MSSDEDPADHHPVAPSHDPTPDDTETRVDADAVYDHSAAAQALTDAASPSVSVQSGDNWVAREASFADVATRPKERAITDADTINDVVFYRQLAHLDGDLAGTIRAKSQVGAMGPEVSHPAMRGHEDELSDEERDMVEACEALMDRLNLNRRMQAIFKQLIIHGNFACHIEYADGAGITDITPLPLQALTITDQRPNPDTATTIDTMEGPLQQSGNTDMDQTIHEGNYYVLNEGDSDDMEVHPADEVFHLAINKWGNWYEDRRGRSTYSVWGERRLAPVKFALQAKQNTLSNKVALDDSLLAREVYHIDVETLFGHIPNDKERTEKAEEYKDKLKRKLNSLAPDEKPILPEEVSVEVNGPDGKTADNQTGFIQMMNDTLQHALTFHSASFGRDAGGSLAGNKPAKEMSDTGVKSLRDVVKDEFRELFRIHCLLAVENARQPATDAEDNRIRGATGFDQWDIKDGLTLPILAFDPVSRRDKSDRVKDAVAAYEKGVADLNEARAWVDLDPIKEDDVEDMFFRRDPTAMEDPTAQPEGEGGVGREQNQSEPNQNQGPGQGKNPNDDGSGEASSVGDEYVTARSHGADE